MHVMRRPVTNTGQHMIDDKMRAIFSIMRPPYQNKDARLFRNIYIINAYELIRNGNTR